STSTSTTTTTMPSGLTCPQAGLIDGTVAVPYDTVGAPALSGARFLLHYPATTSLPNIPTTHFVHPRPVTHLIGIGAIVLGQGLDTNQDAVEDTMDLLYALTNAVFPPGDLVRVRFDCMAGAALSPANFSCTMINASDIVGNDIPNPASIPCSLTMLTLP